MIKTKLLPASVGICCLLVGSCTNEEPGYHVADKSMLSLSLSPKSTAGDNKTLNLSIINAVNGLDTVYVETKSLWKVEVNADTRPSDQMDWTLAVTETTNDDKGSYFIFNSSINRSSQREWENAFKVFVEGPNGEELVPKYLTVRQSYSKIYPTPSSFETFTPAGGSKTITVDATEEWSIESDVENNETNPDGWIIIDRSRKSENSVTFTVLANGGTSPRTGVLRFNDSSGKTVVEVNIHQAESSNTFDIGPDRSGRYVMPKEGGDLILTVLSDKGWRVNSAQAQSGGMIEIEGVTSEHPGNIDTGATEIRVTVSPNMGEASREALIVFSRTADSTTVPSVNVVITQEGTGQPGYSAPWIHNECTQYQALIRARYYSNDVLESGIEIRKKGDADFSYFMNIYSGPEMGLTEIELQSNESYSNGFTYRGGNTYEMRHLVVTSTGEYRSSFIEFKAPGAIPGNGDMTHPGVN